MRFSIATLRRQIWVLPACIGLLLLLRWLPNFGRPVRLFDVRGEVLTVHDGWMVIHQRRRRQTPGIVVQPVRGGRIRLGPLPVERQQIVVAARLTDTHLVYLLRTENSPLTAETNGQHARPTGEFAYELHCRPLNGLKPEMVRFRGEGSAALTEEGCYWWGGGRGREHPLRFVALPGGAPQTIGKGEPQALLPGPRGGVLWRLPPGSDGKWESVWVDRDGKLVEQFDRVEPIFAPHLVNDRLYWVETNLDEPVNRARPHRIVTSRLDGSNRRDVFQASDLIVQFGQMRAFQGRLYLALTENRRAGSPASMPLQQVSLCRVGLGEPPTLDRICVMPAGFGGVWFVEGRDVYIPVIEQREDWWDWSPQGLHPRRVTAWYHYRMPAE